MLSLPANASDINDKKSKSTTLTDGQLLTRDYHITPGQSIVFKDLGRQIGWKTVFLVEYAGPLLIHPLLYFYPQLFYGHAIKKHSSVQMMALAMICVHFAKRELETLFVHRFSHATMPFTNLFKNSFHYWVLSGLLLGYEIYSPSNTKAYLKEPSLTSYHWGLVTVYAWAQLSNLSTHLTLRNLRPAGTKVRKIPYGYGFDAPFNLSCPNYFFESIVWVCIVALTRSYGGFVFLLAAVVQMFLWALKKHAAYRRDFAKEYPRARKAMIPFVA